MNDFLGGTAFGLSLAVVAVVFFGHPAPKVAEPVDLAPVIAKMDTLEEKVVNLSLSKCMVIQTPSLSVYEVPNIGVKKVSKP